MCQLYMSLFMMAYLVYFMPYELPQDNIIEIVNEGTILFVFILTQGYV